MKIAYFLDVPIGLGGAGNLLIQQAALMSTIHDVIIVVPCDENGYENQEYVGRCTEKGLSYAILHYESYTDFYSIDYIKSFQCKEAVKEFVIREQISFLHSVQLNIVVEMVARELEIPHLMDIYQLQKEEFTLAYIDIYPHYHLCDSDLYAKRWSSMLNIKSKCVRPVAPIGKIMLKTHSKKDCYKIIMLGDICERKNQLTAIQAVEKCLEQYNIIVEIAGSTDGAYGNICKNYVQQHNLESNIHFWGFVSDVKNLLQECDCLLCASIDESFPSSIVEAVTYDLTIISTPVSGVPEMFHNEFNAYISIGFGKEEIYKTIMNCMNGYADGSILKIHSNAQQTWYKYFSPKIVRNQINQYYLDIVDNVQVGDKGVYERVSLKDLDELQGKIKMISDGCGDVYKRVLYYYMLKKCITNGKVYIWGAGKLGGLAYKMIELLALNVEVVAFIDRIKQGEYYGKPIIKPCEIEYDEVDYFFISFAINRDEIINFLKCKDIIYNHNVWLLP